MINIYETIQRIKDLTDIFSVCHDEDLDTVAVSLDEVDNEALNRAIEALDRELQFLNAGYKNEEVEFYIGGRKFSVRELAQ